MKNIVIMDMVFVNIIVVGEVVECFVLVIKELVENVIDVEVKNISIEVYNMGFEFISVIDDGSGMIRENFYKVFFRYVILKIFKILDLNDIRFLGFRGEVFFFILFVFKIEIMFRIDVGDGYFLKLENFKVVDEGVVVLNKGIKIIVKEFFYNILVCFKYMKFEYVEKNVIIEIVDKLVFLYLMISFKFYMDNKLVKFILGNN